MLLHSHGEALIELFFVRRFHDLLVARKNEVNAEALKAINFSLNQWQAFTLLIDDGAVEIDNNDAERALRAVALGRENFLHFGSDSGGERGAAIYTLVVTAKLNGLDQSSICALSSLALPTIRSIA